MRCKLQAGEFLNLEVIFDENFVFCSDLLFLQTGGNTGGVKCSESNFRFSKEITIRGK